MPPVSRLLNNRPPLSFLPPFSYQTQFQKNASFNTSIVRFDRLVLGHLPSKSQEKKLICREEDVGNLTSSPAMTSSMKPPTSDSEDSDEDNNRRRRSRRDIEVDPVHREPIIFLGTKSNSSVFIDDGDFDIVSDQLTKEELEQVKKQIMETCNALNSD
ncbi:unnamed protein product [Caenorhabditis auriculariae]|uniref:Uncharacterized protein n=1 Tax=Caenorhabditis auriculariae TaxID=2777116 RepID=A0A8S1HYU9_9PELO|nr:unnamed protein product [Caenorhabditis auriculariae]